MSNEPTMEDRVTALEGQMATISQQMGELPPIIDGIVARLEGAYTELSATLVRIDDDYKALAQSIADACRVYADALDPPGE